MALNFNLSMVSAEVWKWKQTEQKWQHRVAFLLDSYTEMGVTGFEMMVIIIISSNYDILIISSDYYFFGSAHTKQYMGAVFCH